MHRSFTAKDCSKRQPRGSDSSGDKNECAVFSEDFFLEEIVFLEGNVLAFKKLSYFFGVNRMVAESRGKTKRLVAVVAKVNSAAQGF